MNELQTTEIVEQTRVLLGAVRQSLVKVAANLHFLRAKNEFEGKFGQYCEETFGLSQSMTSKLVSLYEGWVIKAGVSQDQIEGQDYERLYAYLPLLEGKDPEQALAEVKTWSRADIKAEKQEKTPCTPDFKEVCVNCWTPKENHG